MCQSALAAMAAMQEHDHLAMQSISQPADVLG